MTTVVKSSSSVYSTYISTVDHLPCDIVRSLWLVQACNVGADTEKQKLHQLLKTYPHNTIHQQPNRQEILRAYQESRRKIQRWNDEALAEVENLGLLMKTHQAMLRRGVESLNQAAHTTALPDQRTKNELLKSQLDKHYQENPLASQVEALQERVMKGSRNVIIKHIPGRSSGVKIILKLPKRSDSSGNPTGRSDGSKPGRYIQSISNPGISSLSCGSNGSRSTQHKRKRGRPRKYPLSDTAPAPSVPVVSSPVVSSPVVSSPVVSSPVSPVPIPDHDATSDLTPIDTSISVTPITKPAIEPFGEPSIDLVEESASGSVSGPIPDSAPISTPVSVPGSPPNSAPAPTPAPSPVPASVKYTEAPKKSLRIKLPIGPESPESPESSESSEAPERYCFCRQVSSGDMIACDYNKCSNGEWFHYKCVGLDRGKASKFKSQKWYCSEYCKTEAEKQRPKKKKRRNNW